MYTTTLTREEMSSAIYALKTDLKEHEKNGCQYDTMPCECGALRREVTMLEFKLASDNYCSTLEQILESSSRFLQKALA